jgi:hypothetical protein
MAALNLQPLSTTGAAEALSAASVGGDSFPLNQPIEITFRNAGAAARTITMVGQTPCDQGVLHNRQFVVPNDNVPYRAKIAGNDLRHYADANGNVQLTYDAVAGLTVGARPATA